MTDVNFGGALGTEFTYDLPERAGRWGAIVDTSAEFWQLHYYRVPEIKGKKAGERRYVLTHAGRFRFLTLNTFVTMLYSYSEAITRLKSMIVPDGAFMESHLVKDMPAGKLALGRGVFKDIPASKLISWYNAASNEIAFSERWLDFSPVTMNENSVASAGVIPAIGIEYLALMLLECRNKVSTKVTGERYFKQ